MAAKLCKEQQKSFGNNAKYSDFIDGKYILLRDCAIIIRKGGVLK